MNSEQASEEYKTASDLYTQGKHAEALEILDRLDALYPNDRRVMYARALALRAVGRPDEARALCERCLASHDAPRVRALLNELLAATPSSPALNFIANLDIKLDDGPPTPIPVAAAAVPEEEPAPRTRRRQMILAICVGVFVVVLVVTVLGDGGHSASRPGSPSSGNGSSLELLGSLVAVALSLAFGYCVYIMPVVWGVRLARENDRSPHWMWLALVCPPFAGWVAYIALRIVGPAEVEFSPYATHISEPERSDNSAEAFAQRWVPILCPIAIVITIWQTLPTAQKALATGVATVGELLGLGFGAFCILLWFVSLIAWLGGAFRR